MNTNNYISTINGTIVEFTFDEKEIKFFVSHDEDAVQSSHLKGRFHQVKELLMIKRYIPEDALILDIGANVGNHAIFFDKFINAKKVIVIEPNPTTIKTLITNILLNSSDKIDKTYLGIGLGDELSKANIGGTGQKRLAAACLFTSDEGNIEVRTGDSLFWRQNIDFIKIDVEGFEIKVLNGLKKTILSNLPLIYVEVFDTNIDLFQDFLEENGYSILDRYRCHKKCENYFIAPKNHISLYQESISSDFK